MKHIRRGFAVLRQLLLSGDARLILALVALTVLVTASTMWAWQNNLDADACRKAGGEWHYRITSCEMPRIKGQ